MVLSPPAVPPAPKQGGRGKKATCNTSGFRASCSEGRRGDPLPKALRKEVAEYARGLAKKYADVFAGDRRAKEQVIRIMRRQLPPGRGRPRNVMVSRAILLFRRFRRTFPDESPRQLWSRVYPLAIPDWEVKSDIEQKTARDELRERILWRRRKRRVRKIPAEISIS